MGASRTSLAADDARHIVDYSLRRVRSYKVHQLVPTFRPGDATSASAIGYQRALRRLGVLGEIFAGEVEPGFDAIVRPASKLHASKDDLVLYHHGIASSLVSRVLHLPCRRGVVFHNITPARFYSGTRLAHALDTGRAQLAALAGRVDVAIGVSRFNARELEVAGHQNVKVVPLLVERERFLGRHADEVLARRLAKLGEPRLLCVGRVVPHKRVEDAVALLGEVRRFAPKAQLVVVGGYDAGHASFKALASRSKQVGGVTFLGRVDHAQLVAAYRSADVLISMSEHEGVGVPLLEAFASDLPVLAFGAAAVGETLGGRGILFDEKHFSALSEIVNQVATDQALRTNIIRGQHERLAHHSLDAVAQAFGAALPADPPTSRRSVRRTRRPRVGFVVQRFGETIVGGAESLARQVALKLAPHASVEIFTTCATDHLSWKNELEPGESRDGPLRVRRFSSSRVRNMRPFNRLSNSLFGRAQDLINETRWVADQGPVVTSMLEAVVAERERFDAVAFFTALYQPAVVGVPLLADRALLVPTAHDEPPLDFQLYTDAFETARRLFCNTPEEMELIRTRFPNAAPCEVVGVGVDALEGDAERFRSTFSVQGPYLLYVGRLEAGKGVQELIDFHQALVRQFHDAPTLVLVGSGELSPRGKRVVATGRIDEQLKWDALSGALAVVVPSQFESLSLLALEAFAAGTPVVGNTRGEVVRGQLSRSKAGAGYDDERSFIEAVRSIGEKRGQLASRARAYAAKHRWSTVTAAWLRAIDRIRKENEP